MTERVAQTSGPNDPVRTAPVQGVRFRLRAQLATSGAGNSPAHRSSSSGPSNDGTPTGRRRSAARAACAEWSTRRGVVKPQRRVARWGEAAVAGWGWPPPPESEFRGSIREGAPEPGTAVEGFRYPPRMRRSVRVGRIHEKPMSACRLLKSLDEALPWTRGMAGARLGSSSAPSSLGCSGGSLTKVERQSGSSIRGGRPLA
jgi:hypothetical protein